MPAAAAHSRPRDENVGGRMAALGATRQALAWLGDWSRLYPGWVATGSLAAGQQSAEVAVTGLLTKVGAGRA